jgi:hypothetical protein
MAVDRPARKHIPIAVKRAVARRQNGVCQCGCGTVIFSDSLGSRTASPNIQWDHDPALRLRDVNRRKTDYVPRQNDPNYLVARCRPSHRAKTSGTGATTAGTDTGKIKKERKRAKKGRKTRWPSRKIPSRPFPKRK